MLDPVRTGPGASAEPDNPASAGSAVPALHFRPRAADRQTQQPASSDDKRSHEQDAEATAPVIEDLLAARDGKSLLRFVLCGSVDDGKSTLLGRMLLDSGKVFSDQIAAARKEGRDYKSRSRETDLAMLIDGLQVEREQGITIDTAYRYFETDRRIYVAIDVPGHEQYTRNMVSGAADADLIMVLVDARKGISRQTRRHVYLASLLQIPQAILVVNKMDKLDFNPSTFLAIADEFRKITANLGFKRVNCVPVSALTGENVLRAGAKASRIGGSTLMELLEAAEDHQDSSARSFRLPVQWICRPGADFRGICGKVASGAIKCGTVIRSASTGFESAVGRILGPAGEQERAIAGQSITLELTDEIDVSRGDIILDAQAPIEVNDRFTGQVIWFGQRRLEPGRPYRIRFATASGTAKILKVDQRLDIDSLEWSSGGSLSRNAIGTCRIALEEALPLDRYSACRTTGSFTLIDRRSYETVAAGMVVSTAGSDAGESWQNGQIDKAARADAKGQKPCILWLTGLSAAGKSTIAERIEQRLHAQGYHACLLDGDKLRIGLNRDLGFGESDRTENIRRIAEVARLLLEAGLIVIVACIAPGRKDRERARNMVEVDEFLEIFIDTPIKVCEARDPKGLYKRARKGEIVNFTGLDAPYERPLTPDLRIDTTSCSADDAAHAVVRFLLRRA